METVKAIKESKKMTHNRYAAYAMYNTNLLQAFSGNVRGKFRKNVHLF